MGREWDAATYDRVADPMARWGADVVGRLGLTGDERVLDAGCGSGRVTEILADRLPGGTVVALDGSGSMVEVARRRLGRFGDRVEYVVADLREPLRIDPVDAIVSTATFHWITDHDRLFANLAHVLRPGGRLVAQCGGERNIAPVLEVLEAIGEDWSDDWHFPSAADTRRRLEAAGFVDVEAWLHDEREAFEPGEPFRAYLRAVVLGNHLARLPAERHDALLDAVASRLPDATIDYVRLNILARRGGDVPRDATAARHVSSAR